MASAAAVSTTRARAAAGIGLPAGACCPRCRSALELSAETCRCLNPDCGLRFPVRDGVPALIDEAASLFDPAEALRKPAPAPAAARWFRAALPSLSGNPVSQRNYRRFAAETLQLAARPRILVVGGGRVGVGLKETLTDPRLEWVETDVRLSERTCLLCDAHQIPFEDRSFEGVVAQAVLEHVVDPSAAVAEIGRVLRPGGIVYAETPFMQQVHAGAYDFTRFTHLGHRRLFRDFAAIEEGPACGPGMALAWSCQSFLLSFVRGRAARIAATVVARLTAFWLKGFDRFLIERPGGWDGASSFFFLGRKSATRLSDRELIAGYRGAQR